MCHACLRVPCVAWPLLFSPLLFSPSFAFDPLREKEKRPKVGDNIGQATHGAQNTHGARKPPGPKILQGMWVAQAAVTERWP